MIGTTTPKKNNAPIHSPIIIKTRTMKSLNEDLDWLLIIILLSKNFDTNRKKESKNKDNTKNNQNDY